VSYCRVARDQLIVLSLLTHPSGAGVSGPTFEAIYCTVVTMILVAGEFKLVSKGSELVSHEVNNRQPTCFCPSQVGDLNGGLNFSPPFR
jgi:hypothetical protein